MSVGHGKYANPRDGDIVEFEVDLTHDTVAVKTTATRGCGAAFRAALVDAHVRDLAETEVEGRS